MSVLKVLVAALTATVLVSSQALALTITNRDAASHTVTIKKGEDSAEYSLPAGESLSEACEEGCVLRLADADDEHAANDADSFVIENGALERQQQ